jgi:hypothetical protein
MDIYPFQKKKKKKIDIYIYLGVKLSAFLEYENLQVATLLKNSHVLGCGFFEVRLLKFYWNSSRLRRDYEAYLRKTSRPCT